MTDRDNTARIVGAADIVVVYALVLAYMMVAGRFFNAIGNKWISLFFSVGLGAIPLLYAIARGMHLSATFRAGKPCVKDFFGSIILMLGVFAVVITALGVCGPYLPQNPVSEAIIKVQIMDDSLPYSIAALTVLPAVFEEVLCRGFILSGLRNVMPSRVAVIVCALLFALLHFDPARLPFTFCAGLALSWVAIETGSLLYPVLMHFAYNFLLFAMVRYGDFFGKINVVRTVAESVFSDRSAILQVVSVSAWFAIGLLAIVAGVRIVKAPAKSATL
jgi:membrane protease YdiL (CAAX protease family)